MITLSGIFRDLLPLQTKLMAEAALLAASADESSEQNFVRKHALAYQAQHGGDIAQAALRVFGNADGAYGANVNQLVDHGGWNDEDELAEAYVRRKGFAYGVSGSFSRQDALLAHVLSSVDVAYQNLDSIELGVTTVDHYFDTLGGISRAVRRARGASRNGLYRRPDARRRHGPDARRTGRARDAHARAQSEMVRGAAGARLRRRPADRGAGHQHAGLVGDHRPGGAVGLSAAHQTFMLDPAMRERLAALNPKASAKIANRLIEAHERQYWSPDKAMLDVLRRAGEELEDRIEGIGVGVAA